MKKRFFVLLILFAAVFGLVSCKKEEETPAHTHTASETWTSDDNYHWKTCSGCSDQLEKAAHSYVGKATISTETLNVTGELNSIDGYTIGLVKVLFDKNADGGGSTTPTVYSPQIRLYASNKVTFSLVSENTEAKIVKIQFTYADTTTAKYCAPFVYGESTTSNGVWTGSESTIALTVSSEKIDGNNPQARLQSITISYTSTLAECAEVENMTEATCTVDGSYDLVTCCETCGKVLYTEHKTIAALGHDYADEYTTTDEKHYKECQREGCDAKGSEATHTWQYDYNDKTLWEEVSAETCTTGKVVKNTCTVCGKEVTTTLDKVGGGEHTWVESAATNPTITDGVQTAGHIACYECSSCHALGHMVGEAVTEYAFDDNSYKVYYEEITIDGTKHFFKESDVTAKTSIIKCQDSECSELNFKLLTENINATASLFGSGYQTSETTATLEDYTFKFINCYNPSGKTYIQMKKGTASYIIVQGNFDRIRVEYTQATPLKYYLSSESTDAEDGTISANGTIAVTDGYILFKNANADNWGQFNLIIEKDYYTVWAGDEQECDAALTAFDTNLTKQYSKTGYITLPSSTDRGISLTYTYDGEAVTTGKEVLCSENAATHTLVVTASCEEATKSKSITISTDAAIEKTVSEILLVESADDMKNYKVTGKLTKESSYNYLVDLVDNTKKIQLFDIDVTGAHEGDTLVVVACGDIYIKYEGATPVYELTDGIVKSCEHVSYSLTVTTPENGTIVLKDKENNDITITSETTIKCGDTFTIVATPSENYSASTITVTGATKGENDVYSVTGNVVVTVSFVLSTQSLTKNAATNGTYVVKDSENSEITAATITVGSTFTVVAKPSDNYEVDAITVTGATKGDNDVYTVTDAVVITVTFKIKSSEITVTAKYSGTSTTNMGNDSAVNATSIGLDSTIFTAESKKNSASNLVGLNKDGTMRFYYKDNDGTSLQISVANGYQILTVKFNIKTNGSALSYYVGTTESSLSSDVLTVNGSSFMIKDTGSLAVQITSIEITYKSLSA